MTSVRAIRIGATSSVGVVSVSEVEAMDRGALLALWSVMMGSPPPRSMSQPLLRRILAWELQARAQGGLPAAVRAKLDSLAQGKARASAPKMKTGGRFLREWNGTTHVVDVVEGGYLWKGERHRSLSAIARAITGAHWSGPRFFGVPEGSSAKAKGSGTKTTPKPSQGTKTSRVAQSWRAA